jgi:hypothetical protein
MASVKLPSTVFRQACPTGNVFAAVQDAEVPTEEVSQGGRFLCGESSALGREETFAETVQSQLFGCEPQLTRLCSQCLLDLSAMA